jgi:hypothetical protein
VRALALAAALAAGCAGSSTGAPTMTRPIDEDLLALLPSGADLLVDVDVEQLRDWPPSQTLMAALPPDARARLERLGIASLGDVDAVVTAASGAGTPAARTTTIVRGDIDLERAARGLGEGATALEYRGAPLYERGDDAVARLSKRLTAFGGRAEVRRAIDLARGEGESVRTSRGDRALITALGRAPTAKVGRPAIMTALVLDDRLRERLPFLSPELEWLAASFAVGDGFDLIAILGTRGEAEARTLYASTKSAIESLRQRTTVRLLGLRTYLEKIDLVGRDNEVHLGYRLPELKVEQAVRKIESLLQLGQKPAAPHE